MIIVNLVILALLVYAAYIGTQRGAVLIALELMSFTIATVAALFSYHFLGQALAALPGFTRPLGNASAFILIWIFAELVCAVLVRFLVLPRIARHLQPTRPTQALGAALNAAKMFLSVALCLIVFAGLPLSASTKQMVTSAVLPQFILDSSGRLQAWFAGGLGHDLSDSLSFFTITSEPESTERIALGFTATGTSDPADETAMLGLINQERTSRGLHPLTMNQKARLEARDYSQEMLTQGYFSHIDNRGNTPFDRMKAAGIKFGLAGENLALAPTLELAHQGLMNSPGHRANILNPSYRTVGIGIENAGPYGLMITQDFTD